MSAILPSANYVVWRKGLGTSYNQNDYGVWRAHFGSSLGPGSGSALPSAQPLSATVPEPTTLVLMILAAVGWSLCRCRGRLESPNNSSMLDAGQQLTLFRNEGRRASFHKSFYYGCQNARKSKLQVISSPMNGPHWTRTPHKISGKIAKWGMRRSGKAQQLMPSLEL